MQFFTLHLYYSETYQALFTCKYARPLPPVKDFLFHVEVDESNKK